MGADRDGVDTHLDDGIVVPSWLGHVTKVEDGGFIDFEKFEELGHAEGFVHARSGDVDRGRATDFEEKIGQLFVAFGDDGSALFQIRIPSVLFSGAGGLTESRKSDLGKAIFDDFVTRFQLVGFPVAKFPSGGFEDCGDFGDFLGFERIIINLIPVGSLKIKLVILGALSDEKMEMRKLGRSGAGAFERIDDLNQELVEFLTRNWADFKMIEAITQGGSNVSIDRGFSNVESLIDVEGEDALGDSWQR